MANKEKWVERCPVCKEKKLFCFDQPSTLTFCAECDNCGYKDPRVYIQVNEYSIKLMTNEMATKKGFLKPCPHCKNICSHLEIEDYKMCANCFDKISKK